MGTYHSYAGDAKLEDSKDNWYRISGMSLSNYNFMLSQQEFKAGDENSFSLISQGVSSTILFKAVNGFATRNPGFLTKMPNMVIGREFLIKDRSNGMDDILPFNGKLDSSGIQTLGKTLIKDNVGNRIFIIVIDNDRLRGALPDQADLQTAFRPMLTLKPVGGGVIDKFTLKIQVTRYFTFIRYRLYRLGYQLSILEGNESIIAERKYGYRIGRNGLDLVDDPEYVSRVVANQYIVATNPSEVIAVNVEHGGVNISDQIGCWWKLINGKCLYIPSFHALPGMEQHWPNNGGVTTSIVTFTETDAYSI